MFEKVGIIDTLKSVFGAYVLVTIIAIGLFAFFVDAQALRSKKLKRDAKIARGIGLSYLIGGPILYLIIKLI